MSQARLQLLTLTLTLFAALAVQLLAAPVQTTHAAPALRTQVTQRGNALVIGNTLAHDCRSSIPVTTGEVGACGTNSADTGADVFWRADSQAEANIGITAAQARSTAALALPAGAAVTEAYLYWAASSASTAADTDVTFDRPGGASQSVTADASATGNLSGVDYYQSVADVTAFVQANGGGTYRVSDVNALALADVNSDILFAGWWMVVIYRLDSEPLRNISVYDGFDLVTGSGPVGATLSFPPIVPSAWSAALTVVAYEGDAGTADDSLLLDGSALSDAQNPANNFFNASHSQLGSPISNAGDLPQLSGAPDSMSGIDIDTIDISSRVTAGQTSTSLVAATNSAGSIDNIFLGGAVLSVTSLAPDFSTSTKTAADLNGGLPVRGDTIEFTFQVSNTGNDAAVGIGLTDALPFGLTYVPGSLRIVSGPNMGTLTDEPGDDQAEYDSVNGIIQVRLGAGADAAQGGSLAVGASTSVSFRATIDTHALPLIENQGVIGAAGQSGAPAAIYFTDGNGAAPGAPPTTLALPAVRIYQCGCSSLSEDGATGLISIALDSIPSDNVTVTLTPSNSQIDLGGGPGAPVTRIFPADATAYFPQDVTATAIDDSIAEGDHSAIIAVSVSSNDGAYGDPAIPIIIDDIAQATIAAQIADNDVAHSIAVAPPSMVEGDSGQTAVTFTVTRSGATAALTSTVTLALGGTALPDSDYQGTGAVLTFTGGQVSKTVTVSVLGDVTEEAAETLVATLGGPTIVGAGGTATIGQASATLTIQDDDSPEPPAYTISLPLITKP